MKRGGEHQVNPFENVQKTQCLLFGSVDWFLKSMAYESELDRIPVVQCRRQWDILLVWKRLERSSGWLHAVDTYQRGWLVLRNAKRGRVVCITCPRFV